MASPISEAMHKTGGLSPNLYIFAILLLMKASNGSFKKKRFSAHEIHKNLVFSPSKLGNFILGRSCDMVKSLMRTRLVDSNGIQP
jgi:hypothetical protein